MRVVLVALAATLLCLGKARAATVSSCQTAFSSAMQASTTPEDRCTALSSLASCFASISPISTADLFLAQGYLDAAVFHEGCPTFVQAPLPGADPLGADNSYLSEGVERTEDVKFFRRSTPNILSFWSLNDRASTFQESTTEYLTRKVVEESFTSIVGAVNALDSRIATTLKAQDSTHYSYTDTTFQNVLTAFKLSIDTINRATVSRADSIASTLHSAQGAGMDFVVQTLAASSTAASITQTFSTVMGNITTAVAAAGLAINTASSMTASVMTSNSAALSTTSSQIDAYLQTQVPLSDPFTANFANTFYLNPSWPVYRWALWSTYAQNYGWFGNNMYTMFGGQYPSNWGDGNAYASSVSSDKNQQRSLFNKRGFGGWSTTVWAEEWYYTSSTNSKHMGVLFRIRNTTPNTIVWTVYWMFSMYGGWGEAGSAAINGVDMYTSTSNCAMCTTSVNFNVPANRVSTIIFVAGSGAGSYTRSLYSGFYNDCLKLPAGLQYVDDLDYASGGYDA